MKKLLCASAVLSFFTLSARNAKAQHLYLGARVGANLASQSISANWYPSGTSSGTSNDINVGIVAGAQLDYQLNDIWSLSGQILYDQKGRYTKKSILASWNDTYNYLEIPILIKANVGTGNLRPFVFAGPSFGIFLSGSYHDFDGIADLVNPDGSIPASAVRSPDISAVLGAGLSMKLSIGQILFIDAAYALGLVNISKPETYYYQPSSIKSGDIRLAAGILFSLDGE